ncbi:MAG: glycosyltransferase family 2 protein [Chloroflexi bacterium]|nr:glycosyltransferase family 2 protein [Chloroflexota bacterium]
MTEAGPRTPVSIVIPARDEEELLPGALASACAQDHSGAIEIVVADGSERPAMARMVRTRFPEVRIIDNPDHGISAGLNRAIAACSHDIVVRCDVRCILAPDHVRRCVEALERTGAACVGGMQWPVGTDAFTRAVAMAMTSVVGSGGARYRRGGPAGPADTVFLGAWRRTTLDAVGGFDETLGRNEDYELAWRLRTRGQTVWLDPEITVAYRPRESLAALAVQHFANGRWKAVMLRRHPRSLRPRQLAAPALTLGLCGSAALTAFGATLPALLLPAAWVAVLAGAAAAAGWRRRDPAALLVPFALVAMHLGWGAGFWRSCIATALPGRDGA